MWKYENKYIKFVRCCYSGFFGDILSLNVKIYLWLKLYTVPFFVRRQTYKISKGSNNYCSHCTCWLKCFIQHCAQLNEDSFSTIYRPQYIKLKQQQFKRNGVHVELVNYLVNALSGGISWSRVTKLNGKMVNGLHSYSAFIQSAVQFMPLIHPFTHTFTHQRRLAAIQGTNQLVRSNWGLGVLLRETSTCPGWDRTGNPPTARWHLLPSQIALFFYLASLRSKTRNSCFYFSPCSSIGSVPGFALAILVHDIPPGGSLL